MDTEERLSRLEAKLAEYDRLIGALTAYARLTPVGRLLLKIVGAP